MEKKRWRQRRRGGRGGGEWSTFALRSLSLSLSLSLSPFLSFFLFSLINLSLSLPPPPSFFRHHLIIIIFFFSIIVFCRSFFLFFVLSGLYSPRTCALRGAGHSVQDVVVQHFWAFLGVAVHRSVPGHHHCQHGGYLVLYPREEICSKVGCHFRSKKLEERHVENYNR